MKNFKTILAIVLISVATISCKKEKKEAPPVQYEKLYSVQYKGFISGPAVTGSMTYWNPETQTMVTETIIGTSITRAYTFKKNYPASITINANVLGSNTAVATAEVYIDGVKKFAKTDTQFTSAYANINCDVN